MSSPKAVGGEAAAGRLSGMILDAATGEPIVGALVHLTPLAKSHPSSRAPGSGIIGSARAAWAARTDASGRYAVSALVPGEYAVLVRALGYAPARLELLFAPASAPDLSVGLDHQPVYLHRVTVTAVSGSFASAPRMQPGAESGATRVATERERQRRFLESDARLITAADVTEAIAPLQADLFRTLQRAPGIATRDDWTAELWTRGAPWSQTTVLFDGVPLFNPLHAAGFLGAVNTDALADASFHPGVQPVRPGGGAAGRLALGTRMGGANGNHGAAELSVLGGSLTLHGPLGPRGAWMVGGRRSHLDLVTRVLADSGGHIPYAWGDVVMRLDHALGRGWSASASGLTAWDALDGSVRGVVVGGRARWGSRAGRLSVDAPVGHGRLRHTVGGSRFAAVATAASPLGATSESWSVYRLQDTDNAVALTFVEGEWTRDANAQDSNLSLGWRLSRSDARYFTVGDWPPDSLPGDTLRGTGRLRVAQLWADHRLRIGPLDVQAGTRVEGGDRIFDAPGLRLAPRLSLRWAPDGSFALSAAASRNWQHEQAFSPDGPGRHAIAAAGVFWMVADAAVRSTRSDLVTLGAERWLDEQTLLTASVYFRNGTGLLIPAPSAGDAAERARYVYAGQRARGHEVQARRLAGRWTGSASYAWQRVSLSSIGVRFDAPWERRHVAQLVSAVQATDRLRFGAALALISGAPFTTFFDGSMTCDSLPGCTWTTPPTVGDASAHRGPSYTGLDLAVDWTHRWASRQLVVWGQLRNALGRQNPAAYLASRCAGDAAPAVSEGVGAGGCTAPLHDRLAGLARLPAVGVRLTF